MTPVPVIAAALLFFVALLFAGLWLRARRRVARAENARETFFDLVTHELRSPLSAILGYHELLQDGAYGTLPDSAGEPLGRIGRSARHLLHLIDGVVELSRIRSGTVRPDLGPVDLGTLFPPVADAFRAAARDRSLEPTVHAPDALPTIRSDHDRLERALDLLITSAIKYPHGSDLHLHMTAREDGATVRVTGTEIAAAHDVDDLALRLGIRLAVVDAIARVIDGQLHLEEDDQGVIRALSFRIPDLQSSPPSSPSPDL